LLLPFVTSTVVPSGTAESKVAVSWEAFVAFNSVILPRVVGASVGASVGVSLGVSDGLSLGVSEGVLDGVMPGVAVGVSAAFFTTLTAMVAFLLLFFRKNSKIYRKQLFKRVLRKEKRKIRKNE